MMGLVWFGFAKRDQGSRSIGCLNSQWSRAPDRPNRTSRGSNQSIVKLYKQTVHGPSRCRTGQLVTKQSG